MLKEEIGRAGVTTKLGALLMKPAFAGFSKKVDYAEYGGVPLLGVKGVVVISHGASGPKAVRNAIRVARRGAQNRITDQVSESLNRYDAYYRKLKPHRFWDSFMRKNA
jgi:phosphate acyltransferase